MKTNHQTNNGQVFKNVSTVSPEEILAAGGATAFGIKTSKNTAELKKMFEHISKPEPFTTEEWAVLASQLENDK